MRFVLSLLFLFFVMVYGLTGTETFAAVRVQDPGNRFDIKLLQHLSGSGGCSTQQSVNTPVTSRLRTPMFRSVKSSGVAVSAPNPGLIMTISS